MLQVLLCALGRFRPAQTGRVLLFAGEDPLELVRERLAGITRAAGGELERLDVFVITAPRVRLDVEDDRTKLSNTVEALKPKLLVLDPFVRLHSGDENVVAEVAPVLDFLRSLQRRFGCSVLLVHHARKNAGGLRGGQALRGSSELFAWTDSNLSLRRKGEQLLLAAEHRSAPALDELPVALCSDGESLALRVVEPRMTTPEPTPSSEPSLGDRILDALRCSAEPMTPRELRDACRVRMARVYQALAELVERRAVTREGSTYRPTHADSQLPLPLRAQAPEAVAGSALPPEQAP
ncbi:MAG TPA: AAA family ATPase [Polyangiaceae bacterium]